MKNRNDAGPIAAAKQYQDTGKENIDFQLFETLWDHTGTPAETTAPTGVFYVTPEELKAVTHNDRIYQAAAAVAIRRGLWVVVDNKKAGAVQ